MNRFARCLCAAVVVVTLNGCGGGGGNPTGPSNSIPNVVGTYNGNVTVQFPELALTLTCPTSTTVTQSGSTVSVAPMVLKGDCDNLSVPVGQFQIDATGAFPNESGTFSESCGVYSYTGSGGFFGKSFKFSMNATSTTCYNFNINANLTRP
jgi:hypothetical protein